MGYSIELYFDRQFETKIRLLWTQLAESGVPSILHKIGSRPHISLAVLDTIDVGQVVNLLDAFSQESSSFCLEFSAIGLIPGDLQSVFLAPVPTSALLEMQSALYRLLQDHGCLPRDHYKPNLWLPHCTISKELIASDALKTVGMCQAGSVIGMAHIIELGLIEFRPRKKIKGFVL
ncbi:2'-5' RNA ligase family protein [Desulfoluna sp.]|uniref:2'-5' RNA ligase family protein n=1 Tax=Desulfoluna sp. TaxID=2045199 RepID=UPI00261065B2|nr:2'-5' RNA ligase family protein [Desulfoluna sp.]